MVLEKPYKDLADTLNNLKIQVQDSMPYIGKYIPSDISTPEQLFYFLRSKVKYKKDPHNVELLQTVQTLMDRDGKGDCDCFTILTLAACTYLGFYSEEHPLQIALVGKSKKVPSHIYTLVWDEDKNKYCVFDLTNPYYCMERSYPYRQLIPFNMTLRLEDNSDMQLSGLFKRDPAKKAAKKARKTAKREGKDAVKMARINQKTKKKLQQVQAKENRASAKFIRKDSKSKRIVNRATSRTDRAQERQSNRMIRTTGKGKIIAQRAENKLNKLLPENIVDQEQDASLSPEFVDPSMQILPDVNAGNYQNPDFDEETEEADYEVMPDEEEENFDTDYYEEDPQMGAGLIPSLITGAAKLITTVSNTKAGQAVQKGSSIYNEFQSLKSENQYLKAQIESEKSKKYYFGGGGFVAGALAGYLLKR